jgi:hypothetical protein
MILVRSDLSRAAVHLSLGMRMGERKFVLKSLFSQDGAGMLDWLENEARGWAARHGSQQEILGEAATVWENKALAAAALLRELKETAKDMI